MNDSELYQLLLERLTLRHQLNIKPIMDANNRINEVFPFFNPFSSKFSPRDKLINVFPSHFSFHSTNRKSKESIKVYICKLNKITF